MKILNNNSSYSNAVSVNASNPSLGLPSCTCGSIPNKF